MGFPLCSQSQIAVEVLNDRDMACAPKRYSKYIGDETFGSYDSKQADDSMLSFIYLLRS